MTNDSAQSTHLASLWRREEQAERIKSNAGFDLVIIGAGIHGASLARQAALRGLRVAVLEKFDIAHGISSRSSKMLHGGVRYLEQGHVSLVKEALRERALFLLQAPHLSRVQNFLLPILARSPRPAWQMRIGLFLYDSLARLFRPKAAPQQAMQFAWHQRLTKSSEAYQQLSALGLTPRALLQYSDGQMDDTRIVIENCVDAVSLGAHVLSFAQVQTFVRSENPHSGFTLQVQDRKANETFSIEARYVVNVSGPWVKEVHERYQAWPDAWPSVTFARGTHLVFDFPWPTDGLIMPTNEAGRYYFIWPYYSAAGEGTLVGPTTVSCSANEEPCEASPQEVEELLGYLSKDFPNADFREERITHCFAGMRVLAGSSGSRSAGVERASRLSRDDVFLEEPGYLALLGGKYTTARRTAEKMLAKVCTHLSCQGSSDPLQNAQRPLPGGRDFNEEFATDCVQQLVTLFELSTSEEGVRQVKAAVQRFGRRAEVLKHYCESGSLQGFFAALLRYLWEHEAVVDLEGVYLRLGWDDFPQLIQEHGELLAGEWKKLVQTSKK